LRVAELRAASADIAVQTVQAVAVAAVQARATATAAPATRLSEARAVLEQGLQTTFTAMQDPSAERVAAISTYYAAQPLREVMPEIDYLRSNDLHLGGRSAYDLDVQDASTLGDDRALFRTNETWTYDEQNPQGETVRCVQETYQVTYILQSTESTWQIQDLRLEGPSKRQDC
jgi:hypothetical protein